MLVLLVLLPPLPFCPARMPLFDPPHTTLALLPLTATAIPTCVRLVLMLALDYTLNNPDTITKYKTAAQISEKVLAEVSKLCVAGANIVDVCEKGDKLIEEELGKVYRGKKITKGA